MHSTSERCARYQRADDEDIQCDDALVFIAIPLKALGPNVAFKAGADVVVGMFELGALAHFESLVQAELACAREARFGCVRGGVERYQCRVGLEARAFTKV